MKKILVVEDNDEINDLLSNVLRENPELSVIQAYSGTEAKRLLEQEDFQLVLLDLNLPGLNGESILSFVTEKLEVPVIVVTANTSQKSKIDLLTLGADDFIIKPFDLDEVYARSMAVLRRSQKKYTRHQREFVFKDLVLNLDRQEAVISSQPIKLTAIEIKILELLLRHPTKVFTKANIYESVWNESYCGDEAIINTHMSNLRKKLSNKMEKQENYIQTVWGIGYKLAENKNQL